MEILFNFMFHKNIFHSLISIKHLDRTILIILRSMRIFIVLFIGFWFGSHTWLNKEFILGYSRWDQETI